VEERGAEEATIGDGDSLEGQQQRVSQHCNLVSNDLTLAGIQDQTHSSSHFHHPLDVSKHNSLRATQRKKSSM
jgi:hypothetical protein